MHVTKICSLRRLLPVVAVLSIADAAVLAQSWSPSNSTTRPSTSQQTTAYKPDWQRSPFGDDPYAPSVRMTSGSQPVRVASRSPVRPSSHSSASASNSQRLAYDVPLAPGERLVGQPTMSEGRSAVRPASHQTGKGEPLPVPDGVSSNRANTGEIIYEGPYSDGDLQFDPQFDYEHGGSVGSCTSCTSCPSGSCGGCASCDDMWAGPPCCPECGMYGYHFPGCERAAMCLENCYGFLFRETSIFAGVQSYKGPLDLGRNGNYGFNEGFNVVVPVVPFPRIGVGLQAGARWTQSNLSGNAFNSSSHDQTFFTAAFFHRAYRNRGLQWGLAYDYLDDNYYVKSTVAQFRGEISVLNGCGHELGFWGTVGVKNDHDIVTDPVVPATSIHARLADQYNFFYRYSTDSGCQARFWGGLTSESFGVMGADFRVPASNRLDFVGGFNYIVPSDGGLVGAQKESWNLSMNVVWYIGRRREGIHNTPYRPLFNVADNGTMMFEPLH